MNQRFLLATLLLLLAYAVSAAAQTEKVPVLDDLYGKGQKEEALALAVEQLQEHPDDLSANHIAGRCLVDLERYEEARPYLERAVATGLENWRTAWSRLYLGFVDWVGGDDAAARAHWIHVRDGKQTENVARGAERYLYLFALADEFDDWTRITKDHCLYYFSPLLADRDLEEFAQVHEDAYEKLSATFGGEPPWPVRYVVWGSREEAKETCGIKSLGFARPRECVIHCRWDQTIGHELTHVISYQALHPVARTPLINEGLAILHDLTHRDRMETARRAVREAELAELDLTKWWAERPEVDEATFYPIAGAWAMTLMQHGGQEKYFELCREQTLDKAREIYGDDLDTWMTEFAAAVLPEPAQD